MNHAASLGLALECTQRFLLFFIVRAMGKLRGSSGEIYKEEILEGLDADSRGVRGESNSSEAPQHRKRVNNAVPSS